MQNTISIARLLCVCVAEIFQNYQQKLTAPNNLLTRSCFRKFSHTLHPYFDSPALKCKYFTFYTYTGLIPFSTILIVL